MNQDKPRSDQTLRFTIAGTANFALLCLIPKLAVWSSVERDFLLAFFVATLAIVVFASVMKFLWQGSVTVRLLAGALLVMPVLGGWWVVDTVSRYF